MGTGCHSRCRCPPWRIGRWRRTAACGRRVRSTGGTWCRATVRLWPAPSRRRTGWRRSPPTTWCTPIQPVWTRWLWPRTAPTAGACGWYRVAPAARPGRGSKHGSRSGIPTACACRPPVGKSAYGPDKYVCAPSAPSTAAAARKHVPAWTKLRRVRRTRCCRNSTCRTVRRWRTPYTHRSGSIQYGRARRKNTEK